MESLTAKNNPLVSVIIGTYNRSNLLSRCLDSVLAQTYKNIEILIIDDASQDNTAKILLKYQKSNPGKIKWLKNNINRGIAYNSNLAFSMSSGEYLALIGDDDEWCDENKILKQLNEFHINKNLGLVTTYWYDVKNSDIVRKHAPNLERNILGQILRANSIYCGSTALISKKAWQSVGGFDESLPRGTDSDLFRSIVAKGYDTLIVKTFSTNVYIDDHIRITPIRSIRALKNDILSHEICLIKFKKEFSHNISSRIFRKYNLFKKFIRLLILEPNYNNFLRFIKAMSI